MGDGSSPNSLSRAGIWRLISGAASFPTLFSTASGVFGLVAGPPSIPFSRTTELLSKAFQLASTNGCATGSRTSSRHVYDFFPRLDLLAPGQPPLLTARLPGATGLAS
jgi:hypothetical protein